MVLLIALVDGLTYEEERAAFAKERKERALAEQKQQQASQQAGDSAVTAPSRASAFGDLHKEFGGTYTHSPGNVVNSNTVNQINNQGVNDIALDIINIGAPNRNWKVHNDGTLWVDNKETNITFAPGVKYVKIQTKGSQTTITAAGRTIDASKQQIFDLTKRTLITELILTAHEFRAHNGHLAINGIATTIKVAEKNGARIPYEINGKEIYINDTRLTDQIFDSRIHHGIDINQVVREIVNRRTDIDEFRAQDGYLHIAREKTKITSDEPAGQNVPYICRNRKLFILGTELSHIIFERPGTVNIEHFLRKCQNGFHGIAPSSPPPPAVINAVAPSSPPPPPAVINAAAPSSPLPPTADNAGGQCDLTKEHSQTPGVILYNARKLLYAEHGRIWIDGVQTKIKVDIKKTRHDLIEFAYTDSKFSNLTILGCKLNEDIYDVDARKRVNIPELLYRFREKTGI